MLKGRQAVVPGPTTGRARKPLRVVCGLREDAPKSINRRTLIGGTAIAVGLGSAKMLLPPESGVIRKKTIAPEVVEPTEKRAQPSKILDAIQHFIAGGIAGSVGATAVYPIDLVKTRMQNERSHVGSKPRFKNGWERFLGVLKEEGPLALYQGLVPQVVGVWPEKAVKLAANDFARSVFMNPTTGVIPVPLQILSGGFGGLCQVIFTNPLEIVKVRLQVVEAGRDGKPPSPIEVVKDLGLSGLYKGWTVCAARDIPFSMIYFPTFALLKVLLTAPGADPSPTVLFLAGLLAGVPAAYLVTPMDVIKTRVQVEPREGEDVYAGPIDCLKQIVEKEGPGALFKGGVQRVLRSAPQFGVTLLVYELINRAL